MYRAPSLSSELSRKEFFFSDDEQWMGKKFKWNSVSLSLCVWKTGWMNEWQNPFRPSQFTYLKWWWWWKSQHVWSHRTVCVIVCLFVCIMNWNKNTKIRLIHKWMWWNHHHHHHSLRRNVLFFDMFFFISVWRFLKPIYNNPEILFLVFLFVCLFVHRQYLIYMRTG